MVLIPPKHRSFVTVPAGIKVKSIPAPEGFSLVTSHVYTKLSVFFENVHHDPAFMNWNSLKESYEKALNYYYPLTGRLVKGKNGRYTITNFDKGALFEMHESADDFQEYKHHNFSYSVVPYDEMIPIKSYVSRDSPLFGIKAVYTRCGSVIINMSFHHKVVDGWCLTQFLALAGRIGRGEEIDEDEIHIYTDKDRTPVQPLPNVNHADLYPAYPPDEAPMPTIDMAPSKKLIFTFNQEAMNNLKNSVLNDASQPKTRISQFDVFSAFIHRSVVKARRAAKDICVAEDSCADEDICADGDSCADMLCIVANQYRHPDDNMCKYLGNFIMPSTVPNTVQDIMDKSISDLAIEIRQNTKSITVPFMESLEHYFNHHPNVENIVGPISGLGRGAIGFSDWSRFTGNYDFGYGPYIRLRSFVDPSPFALITIMPYVGDKIEVIIQLDLESMDQLVLDPDFMSYVHCVN